MAINRATNRVAVGIGGSIAGMTGGVAMMLAAMAYSWLQGLGALLPLLNIAALLFGPMAYVLGPSAVLTGIVIHLIVSAALGVVFAVLTPTVSSRVLGALAGVLYAVLVWGFMTFVALPLLNPTMSARVAFMPNWWFAVHMLFGIMLGATAARWIRTFSRRTPEGRPERQAPPRAA